MQYMARRHVLVIKHVTSILSMLYIVVHRRRAMWYAECSVKDEMGVRRESTDSPVPGGSDGCGETAATGGRIKALAGKTIGLTTSQAARYCLVSPDTIVKWLSDLPGLIGTALTNAGNALVKFFTVDMPAAFYGLLNNIATYIGQVTSDLWAEISSLGTTKTKTFG